MNHVHVHPIHPNPACSCMQPAEPMAWDTAHYHALYFLPPPLFFPRLCPASIYIMVETNWSISALRRQAYAIMLLDKNKRLFYNFKPLELPPFLLKCLWNVYLTFPQLLTERHLLIQSIFLIQVRSISIICTWWCFTYFILYRFRGFV